MKDYYEELWARLPADLEPPDLGPRLSFLLSEAVPGEQVLDLGCGNGVFTSALAEHGSRPVGVDVAQAAIDRAHREHPALDFRLAPIDGPLPLEDCSVKLVWASEVIEHVADTAHWLSEIRRVLAPQGRLLLTTPNHGRLALALHGVERYSEPLGDHLHLYTASSLGTLLNEFGFVDVEVHSAGGIPLLRKSLRARAIR